MSQPIYEITKAAAFDAAHFLPIGPEDHRYRRMHGHSFRVEATVRGPADEADGWVLDLGALDEALAAAAKALDHRLLNELPGLERPTLERLCRHFADELSPKIPGLSRIVVSRPSVGEACALAL
jgi:6-pyruvoyltetrahydropterin/6-carboxytetrahydropterin synthase